MERIKFLLINPTSPQRRARGPLRPTPRVFRFSMLPSLYVAAAMPSFVETRIIDEDVEAIDYDMDADLVGISFMTYNAPRAYEIAGRFRFERGKPVVFGGYHPTLLPAEAGQHADAVCVGDAEPNVPHMIEDFAAGRLKPLYAHGPGTLDDLPLPRRALLRKEDYAPVDVVQATRGCFHRCTFCSVAAFHHYRFRTRPVASVVDELRGLGRTILFMDDSITADRDYARELFSAMIPLGKRWFSQCGIGIAQDGHLLDLAARSGCRGLFVGFETLSQQGLRAWHKGTNVGRDYLDAVRRLHAAGIAVFAGFVFGGDEDTPDLFPRTLAFLLEANVDCLQATRLTPFPGTPLFEEMERQGRIVDRDWGHYDFGHVVFEPRKMSREVLDSGVAWVQRQFYARRRIGRRAWQCLRYLGPAVALRGVLPLNLGYRHKMSLDGTFQRGAAFVPPAGSRAAA